jgi:hypothetical protein
MRFVVPIYSLNFLWWQFGGIGVGKEGRKMGRGCAENGFDYVRRDATHCAQEHPSQVPQLLHVHHVSEISSELLFCFVLRS